MLRLGLVKALPRRLFSTVGSTETKATTKVHNGIKTTVYETVTNIRQTFNTMSPTAKRLTYGYIGCMMIDNVYGTYQGGKNGLEQFRHDKDTHNLHSYERSQKPYSCEKWTGGSTTAETDWQAAYYGCRKNMFGRFLSSTIWPVGIFSRVMPSMIIWMNPPKDGENTSTK